MRILIMAAWLCVACVSGALAVDSDFKVTDEGRQDDMVFYTVKCTNGKYYTAYFQEKDLQNGQEICSDMTGVDGATSLKDALQSLCTCD